ncbi:MAG: ABC transporter ATP-binding protein [Acidobacteriota bacterium]
MTEERTPNPAEASGESKAPALRLRRVTKTFRDGERSVAVLRGVDLTLQAGETAAIVGPSGSGKSTLLHLLGGLDRPDPEGSGTEVNQGTGGSRGEAPVFEIFGRSLLDLDDEELADFRNRQLGFVFQFHQLLPDFDALENVMMPGRIAGLDAQKVHSDARRLLSEVGLEHRLDHFPSELSGGERQRVALCRALLLDPPLVLADEPTGNLDPASGEQVFARLTELVERRGATLVLVTHNPELADRCGRIFSLDQGVLTHNR